MMRLSIDSVSISFGSKQVLSGLYLEGAAGDIVGILGRNGSGKTTLFKCILGLHFQSKGSIRIDGVWHSRQKVLRHFAYLPQEGFLPRDKTVRKGTSLITGRPNQMTILSTDERANSLLDRKVVTLSRGELRYIECLTVLTLERPVVLLDEPFSQLEPLYCERISKYIRRIAEKRLVLITDHIYQDVQNICNRMQILREGVLWKVDSSNESLVDYGYLRPKEAL